MQRENSRSKLLTRRALLLAGGQVALLGTLAARLYYLQVMQAGRYAMLADENRINLTLLAPPRGRIVDRFGVLLATNNQNYRVVLANLGWDEVARIEVNIPELPGVMIEEGLTRHYPFGDSAAHVLGYVAP